MNHFNSTPEFKKDLKKYTGKYQSLTGDIANLENILIESPEGRGKNFTIIHHSEKVVIVKARLACRSLRGRSMRLIYAYHDRLREIVYIEMYFKGDKENEDTARIEGYLKGFEN